MRLRFEWLHLEEIIIDRYARRASRYDRASRGEKRRSRTAHEGAVIINCFQSWFYSRTVKTAAFLRARSVADHSDWLFSVFSPASCPRPAPGTAETSFTSAASIKWINCSRPCDKHRHAPPVVEIYSRVSLASAGQRAPIDAILGFFIQFSSFLRDCVAGAKRAVALCSITQFDLAVGARNKTLITANFASLPEDTDKTDSCMRSALP